jgi:hypothetical protein
VLSIQYSCARWWLRSLAPIEQWVRAPCTLCLR